MIRLVADQRAVTSSRTSSLAVRLSSVIAGVAQNESIPSYDRNKIIQSLQACGGRTARLRADLRTALERVERLVGKKLYLTRPILSALDWEEQSELQKVLRELCDRVEKKCDDKKAR